MVIILARFVKRFDWLKILHSDWLIFNRASKSCENRDLLGKKLIFPDFLWDLPKAKRRMKTMF